MNQLQIAACGIDCSICDSYKVTMEQDLKAAESLVAWYSKMRWIGKNEGAEAVMKKAPLCKGCWNIADDCFFKCNGNCDWHICCKNRQINHCGECKDFPCERYKNWSNENEYYKKAMERLMSLKANL